MKNSFNRVLSMAIGIGLIAVASAPAMLHASGSTHEMANAISRTPKAGELVAVLAVEPPSLSPLKQPQSFGIFWGSILDPLVVYSSNFTLTNKGLVTGWKLNGPNTWRLQLRPNVQFTNGEKWDAKAAAFTLATYRDTIGAPMRAYLTGVLTKTKVISPLVLDVTFKAPNGSFPAVLSALRAFPPKYYAQVGHDGFGLKPIGTGPYKLKNWTRGVSMNLVSNPKYWGIKAKIQKLIFTFATDGDTRANLLSSGAVDFAYPIPVQRVVELQRSKKYTVVSKAERYQMSIFLHANKPSLKDARLRQAISLAVNSSAVTRNVLFGLGGSPNCLLLRPLLTKPDKASCPQPNLQKAKALVAAVGGSPTINFNYGPAQHTNGEAVGQAIAAQLQQAGFKVTLNPMEYSKLTVSLVTQKIDGVTMFSIGPVFPHPSVYSQGFLTSTSITKNCNISGVDAKSAEALAKSGVAGDKLYRELEAATISSGFCMVPLYNEIANWGMNRKLRGFEPPPVRIIEWAKIGWGN